MKNQEALAKDLLKITKAVERFSKKYSDKLDNQIGIYCAIAVIKDRGIFIEKVSYDLSELSVNATSIEKHLINKKLAQKYKEKDKIELKEQKKLIKSQIKKMK